MNWPLLQNSLLVAGTTTALATGFGLIAALWLATMEARWRNLFLAVAIVALALPPFLVTNCWINLLGETGVWRAWLPFKIYSLGGTIWILSLMLWPITLLAVLAAWQRLEAPQFEVEPAMTGFALLRWLLLPVARGELALAAVLTFVLALNNFAVPAILQTKVLPDEMWVRFNTQFDTAGALQLSVPLLIAPVLLLVWATRRGVNWPRIQGNVPARVFRRQLGLRWQAAGGLIAVMLCLLAVALPLSQIGCARRTWTELSGAVEASTGTIWNSFWFAALAATVVVAVAQIGNLPCRRLAICGPTASRRYSRLSVCATVLWLPFFIPGVLIGIMLIKIFNRPVLDVFYQSMGICLLALVIRYFALAWTAARHAMASVDADLVDAARLEGATRWQVFRFAVWPQIAPQMFAAWYVVYLLCLWDVESIVLVQPPGGETLALKIFNLLHYGYAAQVNALCLVLLGVAVLPLVFVAAFVRTRQFINSFTSGKVGRALTSAATGIVVAVITGCSPGPSKNEATLPSKFFARALVIGSRGVGIGEFNKPRSVATDLQGNVYAVDTTGRVQKFSPTGKFLLEWLFPETAKGKPKGMGRDHDGNIVIVEPHYQRVNHFTPEGRLVRQWGCTGTNEGCFILPRSFAENSRHEFFISEYMGAERVQRFGSQQSEVGDQRLAEMPSPLTPLPSNRRGEQPADAPRLIGVIGKPGTGPGEFNRAEGICVDAQDRLYVADSCNHRIQIFSPDGKFIRQYGTAGSRLGELSYPYDIAVDARGYQFVCEFGNSRIQVFDPNCQPIEIIGGPGVEPGKFSNPWSIALDLQGNLYVADALNHRVQKLVRQSSVAAGATRRIAQANNRNHRPTSAAAN